MSRAPQHKLIQPIGNTTHIYVDSIDKDIIIDILTKEKITYEIDWLLRDPNDHSSIITWIINFQTLEKLYRSIIILNYKLNLPNNETIDSQDEKTGDVPQIMFLPYHYYLEMRLNKKIRSGISDKYSSKFIRYLPRKYRIAHLTWLSVAYVLTIFFIYLIFFYKWWLGLFLLVFVAPMMFRAIRKTASEFVLEYIDQNEFFYNFMVAHQNLVFKLSSFA